MQQAVQQPQTIIRHSSEWWRYMLTRGGLLRGLVNWLEDSLAITGRTLLLIFLIYCGAKAGIFLVAPNADIPVWLEGGMFILQLAGLEGSVPGLARRAELLRENQDTENAQKVQRVMHSAQFLTVASIAEGAFHLIHVWDSGVIYISAILLVVRGFIITRFLIELAKVEIEGPRIISKAEHERELAEQQRALAESTDYRQIVNDLRSEIASNLDGLRSDLSAQIDCKVITPEPLDYVAIGQSIMPAIETKLGELETTLSARIPEPLDMAQLALQVAPLLATREVQGSLDGGTTEGTNTPVDQEDMGELDREQEGEVSTQNPVSLRIVSGGSTEGSTRGNSTGNSRGNSEATKMIHRLLKKNSALGPTELAEKAGCSKRYASQVKRQYLASLQPA